MFRSRGFHAWAQESGFEVIQEESLERRDSCVEASC
jgi:hypothetical protein